MSARRRLVRSLLAATLALAVAACGNSSWPSVPPGSASPTTAATATGGPGASTTPTPATSGSAKPDLARTYEQIEGQVESLRGLQGTGSFQPTLLKTAQVREWVTKAFNEYSKPDLVAATSRLLAHLGLLPEGASLAQLQLDLQSEQVIGFYYPKTKQLYVVSDTGDVGALQKMTFAHEYTHALQDQHFGIAALDMQVPDQGDRDLARLSLVEGDAMLSTQQWAQKGLSLGDMLALLGTDAQQQSEQLAKAPAILRANMLFPYEQGLAFVQHVYNRGGWTAVNAIWSKPPASTSQIIHPDFYDQGVEPVAVTLPDATSKLGSGWKQVLQDTFGELQLGIWLAGEQPSSEQESAATSAVSTWAGDRVGYYEGPDDAWAVVMHSEWRSESGASAFRTAAKDAAGRLAGAASSVCGSGTAAEVIIGSSASVVKSISGC